MSYPIAGGQLYPTQGQDQQYSNNVQQMLYPQSSNLGAPGQYYPPGQPNYGGGGMNQTYSSQGGGYQTGQSYPAAQTTGPHQYPAPSLGYQNPQGYPTGYQQTINPGQTYASPSQATQQPYTTQPGTGGGQTGMHYSSAAAVPPVKRPAKKDGCCDGWCTWRDLFLCCP